MLPKGVEFDGIGKTRIWACTRKPGQGMDHGKMLGLSLGPPG